MKKKAKGFTLVELIVVIAIIGILAIVLVPNFMNYLKKARLSTANSNAKLIYDQLNYSAMELEMSNITMSDFTLSEAGVTGDQGDCGKISGTTGI